MSGAVSEAQAFLEALDSVPPNALTACKGWTVHEITAHIAAGADEIARLFEAYGEGLPVAGAVGPVLRAASRSRRAGRRAGARR